jgi:hypothetical protein
VPSRTSEDLVTFWRAWEAVARTDKQWDEFSRTGKRTTELLRLR